VLLLLCMAFPLAFLKICELCHQEVRPLIEYSHSFVAMMKSAKQIGMPRAGEHACGKLADDACTRQQQQSTRCSISQSWPAVTS